MHMRMAYGKRNFPKTWISEGATLVLKELSLSVFRQYDKYLSQIYGDYLELPPVEQRKSHINIEHSESVDAERGRFLKEMSANVDVSLCCKYQRLWRG